MLRFDEGTGHFFSGFFHFFERFLLRKSAGRSGFMTLDNKQGQCDQQGNQLDPSLAQSSYTLSVPDNTFIVVYS